MAQGESKYAGKRPADFVPLALDKMARDEFYPEQITVRFNRVPTDTELVQLREALKSQEVLKYLFS